MEYGTPLCKLASVALLVASPLACHDSAPSPPSVVATRNLGVAALDLTGNGDLWAAIASEADQGARDLNGDGDALDAVLYVYDLRTQQLVNTGLATGIPPVQAVGSDGSDGIRYVQPVTNRELIAFVVDESAQGNADLNGDGDAEDAILHVFDARTQSTTNMRIAVQATFTEGLALSDEFLAFAVDEQANGMADVDGDGQADDVALLVYDLSKAPFGFPVPGGGLPPNPRGFRNPRRALVDTHLTIADGLVGFFATESLASGDLNGDGDVLDFAVLQLFDPESGIVFNSGLATSGWSQAVIAGTWTVLVSEEGQGQDLNGDGDKLDPVIHTYDPRTGVVRNSRLPTDSPYGLESGSELVVTYRRERGRDVNGDGDRQDTVPWIYDPILGTVSSTDLALGFQFPGVTLLDEWVGIPVSESEQGERDLNGDGDKRDIVFHVYDVRSGAVMNLGVDGMVSQGTGRWFLMMRSEAAANLDWNGDGDREDYVEFLWDARTLALANTGWAATGPVYDILGDTALLGAMQSVDLTGDGDLDDVVLATLDLPTATVKPTTAPDAFTSRLASPRNAVALAAESLSQEDFNGDGDQADQVLYVVNLGP